MDRLSNPLVVTCGGRSLDLPFLRYRALAHRVTLSALHLSVADRLIYFIRYDPIWHLDICDLLAGQGASTALGLEELCSLRGLKFASPTADPRSRAKREATLVFLLFLGMLRLMGRLSQQDQGEAEEALFGETLI